MILLRAQDRESLNLIANVEHKGQPELIRSIVFRHGSGGERTVRRQ